MHVQLTESQIYFTLLAVGLAINTIIVLTWNYNMHWAILFILICGSALLSRIGINIYRDNKQFDRAISVQIWSWALLAAVFLCPLFLLLTVEPVSPAS